MEPRRVLARLVALAGALLLACGPEGPTPSRDAAASERPAAAAATAAPRAPAPSATPAAPNVPAPSATPAPTPPRAALERRGLWVLCEGSQRVLEHPERLAWLLDDAAALGVTDLFVQVYRGGRAWYDATLADAGPYERTWRSGSGDALETLLADAHARGLRVHAWVNVLSLAGNPEAPILADLGPAAAMVDQRGRSILDYPGYEVPEPDRGWYRMGTPAVWLDPAAPGVADRLAGTFAELLARYPGLDGLHLDYVRYADVLPFTPGTRFGVGLSFGFGEASRARFRAETGLEAPFGDSLVNANRFDDWRRSVLSGLVEEVAARARAVRPGVEMSAAVISDVERAYLVDFQDWVGWLDAGHLDFAVPMLYTLDAALLDRGVDALAGLARMRPIWVGVGAWLFASEPSDGVAQLRRVESEPALGSALFSWDSLRDAPALRAALARADEPPVPPAPDAVPDGGVPGPPEAR